MLDLRLFYVKLLLSSWKNICAIWRHGLSTNSGNPYGHTLCSTYSGFVFNLLWEGCYALHWQIYTVWPQRHVERYISISWQYFTIDNPEFEKHIPYTFCIYPTELQFSKANTSDKETSFLYSTIRIFDSDVHTSVYDQRYDLRFSIVNFPWLKRIVCTSNFYQLISLCNARFHW